MADPLSGFLALLEELGALPADTRHADGVPQNPWPEAVPSTQVAVAEVTEEPPAAENTEGTEDTLMAATVADAKKALARYYPERSPSPRRRESRPPEVVVPPIPRRAEPAVSLPSLPTVTPEDESAAIAQLQSILVHPELSQVLEVVKSVERRVTTIEHRVSDPTLEKRLAELEQATADTSELESLQQALAAVAQHQASLPEELEALRQWVDNIAQHILEPDKFIELLLPVIGELLNRKVALAQEEVCKALVPIIDRLIWQRGQQDKEAMSAVLAELVPDAISWEIQNAPETIAKAIAPEIALAIQ
ncbi:MAG: hypothetical protein ACUVSQ_12780, partial [Pseudanabaenaceae cyanobacterium]